MEVTDSAKLQYADISRPSFTVGNIVDDDAYRCVWLVLYVPVVPQEPLAIIGIFDDPDKARDACITPRHVLGPVQINVDYNQTQYEWWPGADYPLASKHLEYIGEITAGGGEISQEAWN